MNCAHCQATTTNGLALCEACRIAVLVQLEYLPIYYRNLARWKPGRAGGRPVPGSRVLYDGTVPGTGTGDRVSDSLDETMTMLTTSARTLTDDRHGFARPLTLVDAVLLADLSDETADQLADDEPRTAALLCAALERHLTSLATLEWVGAFAADLAQHEHRLRLLTERVVPGWYAGACRRCTAGTYVVPGLSWVTCGTCGATTYARDHLELILDEARGWTARPMRLAEAVVALVDTEQSVPRLYERIKKWEQRDTITAIRHTDHDGDPVGPKHYRLGDVLDRLIADRARRPRAAAS